MWGSRTTIDPLATRRIDHGGKDVCLRRRLHNIFRTDQLPYRDLHGYRAVVGQGISKYTIFFSDVMNPKTIEFFAKEVIPEFR